MESSKTALNILRCLIEEKIKKVFSSNFQIGMAMANVSLVCLNNLLANPEYQGIIMTPLYHKDSSFLFEKKSTSTFQDIHHVFHKNQLFSKRSPRLASPHWRGLGLRGGPASNQSSVNRSSILNLRGRYLHALNT